MKRFLAIAFGVLTLQGAASAQTYFPSIGAGTPSDNRLYTPTTTLRQACNRSGVMNLISGSNTQSGFRIWESCSVTGSPVPVFWNGYKASGVEHGTGGTMTLVLNAEYPRGTWTPFTCGGGGVCTAADNGIIQTDPLSVMIPAYAPWRLSGSFTISGTGRVPSAGWSNSCDRGGGDEYQVGASGVGHEADDTVLGSGPASCVFPQAVMMQSNRVVNVLLGDSIVAGVNDTLADGSGGRGILGRGLAKIGPTLNLGSPGDQATLFVGAHTMIKSIADLAAPATGSAGWLQLGVNDFFTGSRTSANLIADRATIRGYWPGWRWFETTVTPDTTTTDNWQTAANQTPANTGANTNRTTFNGAERSTPPVGVYVIDLTALVETATTNLFGPVLDGGVWIPGYVGFSDGVHPSPKADLSVESIVENAARGISP